MSDKHGMVFWSELMTRDTGAACDYYSAICGWRFQAVEMGNGAPPYNLAMRDGVPVAGIMDMGDDPACDGVTPYWLTYIAVSDLEATIAHTVSAGGSVKRPIFEVPDTGRIAIVIDPTGAELGIMTPDPMPQETT